MNTQWIPWIAGGLMVAMPILPTIAQNTSPKDFSNSTAFANLFPALAGVQLTSEQRNRIERLTRQVLSDVQSLLTPAQQTQFNTSLSQGKGVRVAALSLDLSQRQRLQLLQVLQPLRSQVADLLSPEQQQQIERNIQNLQNPQNQGR